ncbi:MAG: phosphatidylglycerol lysyltransferase domain-containing protein [Candidatus Omnitrophica bacterium]|nr:phosphatidylglycerol lysyltransferase domain-containing protein [Candidatus Omnitrophota bacterium]
MSTFNTLQQFVPNDVCLSCRVCCRFADKESVFRPSLLKEDKEGLREQESRIALKECSDGLYCCEFFDKEGNRCSVYDLRPFECRIYPFVIVRHNGRAYLGIDSNCPYAEENRRSGKLLEYAEYLRDHLLARADLSRIHSLACDYGGSVEPLKEIERVSLKEIALGDRAFIEGYLKPGEHRLSAYSFAGVYIWKDFFDIRQAVFDGGLFILFKNGSGAFLYLNPLGKGADLSAVNYIRDVLKAARIDNVEEDAAEEFRRSGLRVEERGREYVYLREEQAALKGGRFKSKRADINYFLKNYRFQYRPYKESDKDAAVSLLEEWAKGRKDASRDRTHDLMLEDALRYHRRVFEDCKGLGLAGRVVEVEGRLRAYSFGFELNTRTFCVLLEAADLKIKGLAQFIFREFCKERKEEFINVMDDSGLEDLRKTKLSYRPHRIENYYTVLLEK